MTNIVSVIIPIHNGSKTFHRALKHLLSQQYSDFEVILVENNSNDDSWKICQEYQKKDSRIKAFTVSTKGTSLARKYGVLQASGTYIIFHDQDDQLIDPMAITNMVRAIEEDQSDICQFGYIKTLGGIKVKKVFNTLNQHIQIFNREQIMDYQIKGILGFGWDPHIVLGTQVWSKIYKAEILKEAVSNINESLYFCEDEYLNIYAFFHPKTERVSVRDEYYYCWDIGSGFSSTEAARMTFLKDYQYIKQASIPLIREYSTQKVLSQAYWDSLTVYKWAIYSMLYDGMTKDDIIKAIEEIERYPYIQEAKKELRKLEDSKMFKDADFLSSNYSSSDYYDYCRKTLPSRSMKTVLKTKTKKAVTGLIKSINRQRI